MALLNCRECGESIDSNTRQTRCKGCGTLFPFGCAACNRSLRPPFPVFSDERYLTEENEPLCQQHFQRQCPQCQQWFQADKNPGFFLCPECSLEKTAEVSSAASPSATRSDRVAGQERDVDIQALDSHIREEERSSKPLLNVFGVILWILILVLLFVLGRQVILFLEPLVNGL